MIKEDASRVQFHANEFYKITLAPEHDYARRIHIWDISKTADVNIHGHCWPFTSFVLFGALVEELYSAHPGREVREYEFYSNSRPMKFIGTAALKRDAVVNHSVGELYRRDGEQLHLARPNLSYTVTAVTHPLSRSQSARVYVRFNRLAGEGRSRAVNRPELSWLYELLGDLHQTLDVSLCSWLCSLWEKKFHSHLLTAKRGHISNQEQTILPVISTFKNPYACRKHSRIVESLAQLR